MNLFGQNILYRALRNLPKDFKPHRILLVGTGTDSELKKIRNKFTKSHVTVVQNNPEAIKQVKLIYTNTNRSLPEIFCDDPHTGLRKAPGTFDLILIQGDTHTDLASLLADTQFIHDTALKLSARGWLFVIRKNAQLKPNKLASEFSKWIHIVHKDISIVLYRHFGQGLPGEPLPSGMTLPQSIPKYLESPSFHFKIKSIWSGDVPGIRSTMGPMVLEQYFGDTEPTTNLAKWRPIFWQPYTKTIRPKGWWSPPFVLNLGISGYVLLDTENYADSWSSTAKLHRKQWQRQSEFVLETTDLDTFINAFRLSTIYPTVGETPLKSLAKKCTCFKDELQLYIIRNIETQKIAAGLAVLNFPEHKFSLHVNAFVMAGIPHYINVGLIDHWFIESRARQYTHLNFGQFLAPGYPKSWIGFSKFKAQFGTKFIHYPEVWMKIKT